MSQGDMQVKIVVTYGGLLGRLMRKVGQKWNHAFLLLSWGEKPYRLVYESDWRGVHAGPLLRKHLAEEFEVYELKEPLDAIRTLELIAFAEGNCYKPYGYYLLPLFAWRLLKSLLRKPGFVAFTRPAEVCSSFVQACFEYVGVDLCPGKIALPDDLANSPLLKKSVLNVKR